MEDEDPLRNLLREVLEQAGFDVVAVGDGADALERTADAEVDLILLDLVMPGARIDGFALLSQIRNRPDLARTPLIIVSALGDTVAAVLGPAVAHALSIASVVPKPFEMGQLVDEVRRVLAQSGSAA